MSRYDNLPAKDARRAALQTLALAKWIQTQAANLAKPLEEEAKQVLALNHLEPGDRTYALIEGDEVATVSRSKRTTRRKYVVSDETALGHWLTENGHEDPWQMRLKPHYLADGFITELVKSLEGELPDGIGIVESASGGTVSVRQTDTQRETLERHIRALAQVTHTFTALIEKREDNE